MRLLLAPLLLLLAATVVHADVYMHHPRGSNDRLNEEGPNRNNGNRLFDSQNNNRGGYNVGSVQRIYYYEGSVVPVEWTQQHSCGNRNGNSCELILQYTCGDRWVRDGQTTNTIPTEAAKCAPGGCDTDAQFGRHESLASYMACRYRARNAGLFIANQNVRGLSARHTRQNKNGNRNGYECPEERDYYPQWHPSIWRDAAIITNRPERCAAYKAQSQNVSPRSYCQWDANEPIIAKNIADNKEGWVPITQELCENNPKFPGGKWITVPAFGIEAPECVEAPFTRDNHLGNAVPAAGTGVTNGFTAQYNWTVPAGIDSANCVLRIRYNISTGEFPSQGFVSATELGAGIDSASNVIHLNPRQPDNNARYPSEYPIWAAHGLTRAEVNGSFTARVRDDDPDDDDNGGRAGGIKKAQPPSRDYTLRDNPQVDIFGPLLPARVSADSNLRGQPLIRTRLAINTAQYGRTFEDRSHSFEIRQRPASLKDVKIHNLSVRGKKGNIVQTYPGVEYDFVPDRLHVSQGDMVHIQWTGSSPQGGEGEGNNGDRSNLLLMRDRRYSETGQAEAAAAPYGQWGRAYPSLINDTSVPRFLGLDFTRLRMLALNGLKSSHFDIGPVQATTAGEFRYMCSRNNAFSNRSQKGALIVSPNPEWVAKGAAGVVNPPQPVSVTGTTRTASGRAWLRVDRNDGSIVIPGSVIVDDMTSSVGTPTEATDGSGSGSWFLVRPATPLGIEADQLWLEAERPMPSNFFYKGRVMYKSNVEDEPVEVQAAQGFFDANNRVSLTQGGYYQSTSVPNTPLIAGLTVGLVGLFAICFYAYWRVRVQPLGGWKAFCAKGSKGAYAQGDSAELVSPGAASSSSPTV